MSFLENIKRFNDSNNPLAQFIIDIIYVIIVVIISASIFQIIFGLWTPMVAVESGSMEPHIQIGDIVFVENIDRTNIITYEIGKETGYSSFDEPGDVILYKPQGGEGVQIIHRAMYYVEQGSPMWTNGPLAPHAGYITKGDNPDTNPLYDQQGSVSFLEPIKKEWIIGVAKFRPIPLLGYISLAPREALKGIVNLINSVRV